MLPPCSACLCAIFPSRVLACSPAVHHRVCSCSQGYSSCMYECWTLCMYATTALCLFVRYFPVARRTCSHARPPYIIAFNRYHKYIFYACMCARRYVCTLPPCFACSCHVCPLLVLAGSPVFHECTFTRCPLLNVVASMPIRRQIFTCVTTTKYALLTLAYRCACCQILRFNRLSTCVEVHWFRSHRIWNRLHRIFV